MREVVVREVPAPELAAELERVGERVARPILKFAAKRTSVKAAVVRKKALTGLAKLEPKAAKAWRKYDARRHARRRRR